MKHDADRSLDFTQGLFVLVSLVVQVVRSRDTEIDWNMLPLGIVASFALMIFVLDSLP